MIVFPEKLLVIETTLLPINVTLAERQPLCLIFGPQDVGAYLLRILLPTNRDRAARFRVGGLKKNA